VATTLVVMATGNHYLLDAFAGAFTMAAGAGLMLVFTRRRRAPLVGGHESLDEIVAGRSFVAVRAVTDAARDTTVLEMIANDQVCSRGTSR
jgi:hypothetical protein